MVTFLETLWDLGEERLLFLCDPAHYKPFLNLQYIHCPVRPNQTYIHTLTLSTQYTVSSTFSFSVGLHMMIELPQHSITSKKGTYF